MKNEFSTFGWVFFLGMDFGSTYILWLEISTIYHAKNLKNSSKICHQHSLLLENWPFFCSAFFFPRRKTFIFSRAHFIFLFRSAFLVVGDAILTGVLFGISPLVQWLNRRLREFWNNWLTGQGALELLFSYGSKAFIVMFMYTVG